jgi:hypothetical protein
MDLASQMCGWTDKHIWKEGHMLSRKLAIMAIVLVLSVSAFAEEPEGPEAFSLVFGPRLGFSGFWPPEGFSSAVSSIYPGDYVPVISLFGITVEQRILLGQTKSHFAFQEVVLVGGLEQGIALPEGAVLIGYRDASGFEFGAGPILHIGGVGVIVAMGYTISFKGMYVPVDLSLIIPTSKRPASIGLTTGFNFQVNRRERQGVVEPPKTPASQKPEKTP